MAVLRSRIDPAAEDVRANKIAVRDRIDRQIEQGSPGAVPDRDECARAAAV